MYLKSIANKFDVESVITQFLREGMVSQLWQCYCTGHRYFRNNLGSIVYFSISVALLD